MEPVKDSIYAGLPRAEYDRWASINFSVLKHMSRSPAHCHQQMIDPPWPSKAMAYGNLVHTAVLEPRLLATEYAVPPVVPKVGKVNIATWKAFEAENPHMVGTMRDGKRWAISADDMHSVQAISAACWKHPRGRQILEAQGQNELTVHWTDDETDEPCKGRMDRVCVIDSVPVVVDLKTTSDPAVPSIFERTVARYQYHCQAAWYLRGLTTREPAFADADYWFLVVEIAPPHGVRVMKLAKEAIDLGWERMRRNLDEFSACKALDAWPGYPPTIPLVGLPPWAMREEES